MGDVVRGVAVGGIEGDMLQEEMLQGKTLEIGVTRH